MTRVEGYFQGLVGLPPANFCGSSLIYFMIRNRIAWLK